MKKESERMLSAAEKLDSVSFFYMWGGNITWAILTIVCLLAAVVSFGDLPAEIPVQWSGDNKYLSFFL